MPDIADGDSVEMQGSGAKPYILRNVGGVYSCTCPAWRNQSIGIERRTCKHLRKYRGEDAEAMRVNGALPARPAKTETGDEQEADGKQTPPLLLAESWDNSLDLSGWWMSEKLDGVRAYWDGQQFLSRQGNLYHAPDWFLEGLPNVPLDGELWIDRKAFQRTVSIVRRQDKSDHWKAVRYVVFDAPTSATTFEERVQYLKESHCDWKNSFVTIHEHSLCRDSQHLRDELQRIESLGGEGLMLRQPGSRYAAGRSATLLKVKTFFDAEAVVIGHEPGKGRHQNRLGALTVQLPNGKQFSVGTGFSDKQREQPPPLGSSITFRYQELSDAGIPRFPSYVGIRADMTAAEATPIEKGEQQAPSAPSPKPIDVVRTTRVTKAPVASSGPTLINGRYFECIEGTSSKFWEIGNADVCLTTRWGRIGTKGNMKTKKFKSVEEAWAERNSSIEAKLASGYKEIEVVAPPESAAAAESSQVKPSTAGTPVENDDPDDQSGRIRVLRALAQGLLIDSPDAPPSRIQLVPAEEELLAYTPKGIASTDFLRDMGFTLIGDFAIRELPIVLRAFYRAPNVFAVLNEMVGLLWSEFSVQNADGSNENWTNVPDHDGLTPPWSTVVVKSNNSLSELYAEMNARRPQKEPAQVSADQFASLFEQSYARGMEWRSSAGERADVALRSISPEIQEMVWNFVREFQASPVGFFKSGEPGVVPSGARIMQLSSREQIEILKACFLLRDSIIEESYNTADDLHQRLLKKKLPFTASDVEFLADQMEKSNGINTLILGALEEWSKTHSLTDKARGPLRRVRDRAEVEYSFSGVEQLKTRIDALVGETRLRNPIQRKEIWSETAIDDVEKMPDQVRTAWVKLLQHCSTAKTGKPPADWIKKARPLIQDVTRPELVNFAMKWFSLVDKPRSEPLTHGYGRHPLFIIEDNQDILRGLVWCCCLESDGAMARSMAALATSAYRKIPQIGARAVRVGNACVYGLGVMADTDAEAVTQLAILKVRVKFGTAQRYIEAELNKAAERLGLPREELEEMSIPAYGLDEVGLRREELGEYTAEIRVVPTEKTALRWLKADGSVQKSVPAAVQAEFREEIKELKDAVKDIDKMLPIQRERIDSLFLREKTWPLPVWRDRYLNHPLVGTIARRVIWRFRSGDSAVDGIYHAGKLVGSDDRELPPLGDDSTVELWHPIGRPISEIVAWREWLERHEIQQPFKQAHREVYLLTDAEQTTRTYSNRFAAHILRNAQFRALASSRCWQAPLLGYWDGGDSARASRHLPRWNLVAEFWILGLPPDDNVRDQGYGSAGMPYISSDQVRFCRVDDRDNPLPLADIPPLVFSEVLRDVDLFVGVASVGNDPTWMDAGANRQHADYWHRVSFGALSATAETRSAVLERLLPRLKIADRCELSGRFLVVRGDLRTYKIHLGSSNILMSPNDQYLCIVPKATVDTASSEVVFLPFEGDRILSIILSKAFLLAADKKIKDLTIVRQITQS